MFNKHFLNIMLSVNFYLDQRRYKPGNPCPLKISFYFRGKFVLVSTDIKLLPEHWDPSRKMVVRHPNRNSLNNYIQTIESHVNAIFDLLREQRLLNDLSVDELRSFITSEIIPGGTQKGKYEWIDKTSFLYRFKQYMETTKPGTRKTFEHTLNRLTAYLGEDALKELKFEDITVTWLKGFDNYMAQTAKSKNTRNIHYRNMRTVFNDAIDDQITTAYPFRRFKIKAEVTKKRDLTVEKLRVLFFYNCEEHAAKYRDYFKLMFFLMGINCVDLCHLKGIDDGRIEFHRTKTNHFFSMKIEPEAMELIEKYHGKNWLLDILDHWTDDGFFRRKMNKALQKIGPVTRSGLGGKKAYKPLFPKLTTYYSRHSWASIASSIDIPIETISAGLGHEYGNRITAIYINYDNRKVDIANRKVIDWVLYGKIDGKEVVKPGTPEFFGLTYEQAVRLDLCKCGIDEGNKAYQSE